MSSKEVNERLVSYAGTARVAVHSATRQMEMAQEFLHNSGFDYVTPDLNKELTDAIVILGLARQAITRVFDEIHSEVVV